MDVLNYLKKYQPIPYQIFLNALSKDNLSHAYLLSGTNGTPLFEVAKFIAKSMIQGNNNYFDYDELIDYKVENQIYGDLIILDGRTSSIKIDQIRNIEDKFSKTAIESRGTKIYIINLIENMNLDSTNALLKFLEEPVEKTYAFLTTENEFSILPTIKSRAQIIHFSSINKEDLISESMGNGATLFDSFILSYFYNDPLKIYEFSTTKEYQNTIQAVYSLLDNIDNKNKMIVTFEKDYIKLFKSKQSTRLFIDILIVLFKESLNYQVLGTSLLKSEVNYLNVISSHVKNVQEAILLLMNYRNEINYNINTTLLLFNLINKVFEA